MHELHVLSVGAAHAGAVRVLLAGGLVPVSRRGLRDHERLHETVRQLVEAGAIDEPQQLPYYVRAPARPGMGQGWVWRRADGKLEMLGSNAYLAHAKLLQLFPTDVAGDAA